MSEVPSAEHDPFRTMLVWSVVLHVALFAGVVFAARNSPSPPILPEPGVAWIVPAGPPGPGVGGGGGTPPSPPAPEEPEPPEPPDSEEAKPRVVRPTKEERDQIPMPDAREGRRRPQQASSGLTGRDSAIAPSAKLESATGIPGLGLGGGGGGSAFDQDFEYAYYVQQMLGRISLHWQRVPVRGQAVVIIRFTIFKDGHLGDVQVEQSSGLAMLDRAAERAVYLSEPMPPLPNSYPRDRVGVHLRFEYSDQQ